MPEPLREARHIEEVERFLTFDYTDGSGGGFMFPCDEAGNVTVTAANSEAYARCQKGEEVGQPYIRTSTHSWWEPAVYKCEKCGGEYDNDGCSVNQDNGGYHGVCNDCWAKTYPQGWRAYPGDTCEHGKYTGGCGVDWICHWCEMGVSREEMLADARYRHRQQVRIMSRRAKRDMADRTFPMKSRALLAQYWREKANEHRKALRAMNEAEAARAADATTPA